MLGGPWSVKAVSDFDVGPEQLAKTRNVKVLEGGWREVDETRWGRGDGRVSVLKKGFSRRWRMAVWASSASTRDGFAEPCDCWKEWLGRATRSHRSEIDDGVPLRSMACIDKGIVEIDGCVERR